MDSETNLPLDKTTFSLPLADTNFKEPLSYTVERGCQTLLGISTKTFRRYLTFVDRGLTLHGSKTPKIERLRKSDAWNALAVLIKELDAEESL